MLFRSVTATQHRGDNAHRNLQREDQGAANPVRQQHQHCAQRGRKQQLRQYPERAEQKKGGRDVATSLLFFGCRRPGEDYLYGDAELKEWSDLGVVDVRPAFSRETEASEGCHYVQE